jgi:hypothetical protein
VQSDASLPYHGQSFHNPVSEGSPTIHELVFACWSEGCLPEIFSRYRGRPDVFMLQKSFPAPTGRPLVQKRVHAFSRIFQKKIARHRLAGDVVGSF